MMMLPGCQESGNMMCLLLRHPPHCSLCLKKQNKFHSFTLLHIPSALYWRIPYVCSMYMYTATLLSSETAYSQRHQAQLIKRFEISMLLETNRWIQLMLSLDDTITVYTFQDMLVALLSMTTVYVRKCRKCLHDDYNHLDQLWHHSHSCFQNSLLWHMQSKRSELTGRKVQRVFHARHLKLF